MHVKTTLILPRELLAEAMLTIGVKTKTQAIINALTEAIQRRRSRRLLSLKGSLTQHYDYKASRRKR